MHIKFHANALAFVTDILFILFSLTSLISYISFDDVRTCAALCGLQHFELSQDCRSALEREKPYSKFSFGGG